MPFIAVHYVYRNGSVPDRDRIRPAHRDWLGELVRQGHVLTAGPYLDDSGALLLLDAPDTDAAAKLLSDDPFTVAGIVTEARYCEWKPVSGAFSEL
ncbi:YciI family protein [Rhodococcus sp. NPDC127528]|uniref:YciI family protein n=1 Tax=unclassified Rhodococcus (in: high G+C Gram-positive bacteria) TaxID=192944 RepID=UPI0036293ED6